MSAALSPAAREIFARAARAARPRPRVDPLALLVLLTAPQSAEADAEFCGPCYGSARRETLAKLTGGVDALVFLRRIQFALEPHEELAGLLACARADSRHDRLQAFLVGALGAHWARTLADRGVTP